MASQEQLAEEMLGDIQRQDIGLDDRIVEAGQRGMDIKDYYIPGPVQAMIGAAVEIFREDPNAALSKNAYLLRAKHAKDIGATTLANMVNGSYLQAAGLAGPSDFSSNGYIRPHACDEAERYFLQAVEDLETIVAGVGTTKRAELIHDNGRPLLLRKMKGAPTALLLTPLKLNGVTYPVGSIIRNRPLSKYIDTYAPLIPADDIKEAAFLRLSAFAYPSRQRALFAASEKQLRAKYLIDQFYSTTVDSLANLAGRAITTLQGSSSEPEKLW